MYPVDASEASSFTECEYCLENDFELYHDIVKVTLNLDVVPKLIRIEFTYYVFDFKKISHHFNCIGHISLASKGRSVNWVVPRPIYKARGVLKFRKPTHFGMSNQIFKRLDSWGLPN